MKCTESEEEVTKGKENQLQLSCFINQEVKYLFTGLKLVRTVRVIITTCGVRICKCTHLLNVSNPNISTPGAPGVMYRHAQR